jgi:hypothetical protein
MIRIKHTAHRVWTWLMLLSAFVILPSLAFAQTTTPSSSGTTGSTGNTAFPLTLFQSSAGVSQDAQTAATPIVELLNWAIGIFAAILLVYALFHVLVHIKKVLEGKGDIKSYSKDFITLGIAIMVLMLAVTGGWYQILNFVYNFGIQHIFSVFQSAPGVSTGG